MMSVKTVRYSMALSACMGAIPAVAAGLSVGVEIPRMTVAEYHRPYVAMWVERADNTVASTLAVWYDVKMRDGEGTKWLKDLRQWWRRTGRELSVPIDGVTSPTRPPGKHLVNFTEGSTAFAKLDPGQYKLVVEASREVGGREMVTIPFQWPAAKAGKLSAQGKTELGEVTLEFKP
jgi:hypothetical protein